MGKFRFSKTSLLTALVLMLIATTIFIIQTGVDPSYKNMTTDSGTFAYCGKVIVNGGLMYRDCWDNKPPGVYYLNALAILLGGANPFAIWLFQAIWLTMALWAFFLILRRIWGLGLATLAAFILIFWVLYPAIFTGGNFTETYAILPAVLSMGAFWAYLRSGNLRWVAVLGVLIAAGFLLKPTYISMGLAAGAVLAYLDLRKRKYKAALGKILIIGCAALIPLVLISLYWVLQHDFYELWFAVIKHNIGYVESGFSLRSLYGTVRLFLFNQPMASLSILVILTYCFFLYDHFVDLLPGKKYAHEENSLSISGKLEADTALVWWQAGLGLALILDTIFLASSGKNFGHYLQVMLPIMVASVMYLPDKLIRSLHEKKVNRSLLVIAWAGILLLSLPAFVEIAKKEAPSRDELITFWHTPNLSQYEPNELEQYIIDHSQPSEAVLIWGGHPSMNFLTNRRSPTRYIFLQHLFTATPSGPNGFSEFLQALQNDPPALIVAQPDSSAGLPFFGSPEASICPGCSKELRDNMLKFKLFVESNYKLAISIWDWNVYAHVR